MLADNFITVDGLRFSTFPTRKLISWFKKDGRKFAWRNFPNPYKVLIAEKLLQQTKVSAKVVATYNQLLEKYPNIEKLGKANSKDLKQAFKSLGLTYRGSEIKKISKIITTRHQGNIPTDYNKLIAIPGIGAYIARAILCFGFEKRIGLVDTNIARIFYRYFGLPGTFPNNPARSKKLNSLADRLVEGKRARDINLALIDLGALICKPSNPICINCPIKIDCTYGLAMLVSERRVN